MDLEIVNVDARITEHRSRTVRAERRARLLILTPDTACAAERPAPAAGAVLRAVDSALRWAGRLARDSRESLRSNEHDLANLGYQWPADAAHDQALAEETRAAQRRRHGSRTTSPAKVIGTARTPSHDTSTRQRPGRGPFTRPSGRTRLSPRSATVSAAGRSGT